MKQANLRECKRSLLALRARLRGEVDHMAEAAFNDSRLTAGDYPSRMPMHMAELGTDAFEQEFTLRLMENDEGILRQIESSLERIEEGTYGKCDECGAAIPKLRLAAIPYAAFCVECALLSERNWPAPAT